MLLLRHAVVVRWAIDDNDDGYTDQDTDDALLRDFRIKRPTRCLEGAKGRKARKQARKPVYCTVGLSAALGPTHLVLVFGGWISMTCCVVPPIQYVGAWVRVCMRSLCSFLLTCMKVRQGIYGPGLRNQRGRRGAKSHQIWKSEVSLFFFLSLPLSFTVQGNISLHSKPHFRLLRSFRIYLEGSGPLAVDVKMSIPEYTLPLHIGTCRPCSQAHAFSERLTQRKKKRLEVQGTPL